MFSNSERRKLPKPVTLAESQDQFRRISEKWQSLSAEEKKVGELLADICGSSCFSHALLGL